MGSQNPFELGKITSKNGSFIAKVMCLSLVFLFIITFLFVNPTTFQNASFNNNNIYQDENFYKEEPEFPNIAADTSLYLNPFTRNFSDISEFFLSNYEAPLNFNVSIYYRNGDSQGNIRNNITYLEDNLLLYNSLLKQELNDSETYTIFQQINSTSFWYNGNRSLYKYGFVRSINGTTGKIIDNNRYLIDNLMPIFLLIENMKDLTISSNAPIKSIETMFKLINSTQFWDNSNQIFRNSNSSNNIFTECNLYSILANLLINNTKQIKQFFPTITTRALYLANQTMLTLIRKMWDNSNYGFYNNSLDNTKYLHINALGILALLGIWKKYSTLSSPYFVNATLIYNKLNKLWNSEYKAYNYSASANWGTVDNVIDLEANAIMMRACLKLFEISGNITYYNRAFELYNTFEKYFYDSKISAYNTSIGVNPNPDKNFRANLLLTKAYLNALEIYNKSVLIAAFNVSGIPNYVMGQDILKITCNYTYQAYLKKYYIINSSITYLIKYPNGTLLKSFEQHIEPNVTTGSVAEKTQITCIADYNNTLNHTYFLLNTPSTKFYVWINMSGKDPKVSGRIGIQISNISTNATNIQVARNITTVLSQMYSNIFTVSSNNEIITILNREVGDVENASDGPIPNNTSFGFKVNINGANRSVTEDVLLFPITENIPVAQGYKIVIFANITYFRTVSTTKYFNVISGLKNLAFTGVVGSLYQGQTVNVTLLIESTRKNNCTLNVSLEGDGFVSQEKEFNLTASNNTLVSFILEVKIDATPGTNIVHFKFRNATILYLDVAPSIVIVSALDYDNLIYDSKTVSGGKIRVMLNLINLFPENSTSLNMSFTGENIGEVLEEVTLNARETKTVSFDLSVSESVNKDVIEVNMEILIGKSVINSKILSIEVIPKLEILSSSFPDKINQGEQAFLIIIVQNNQEKSENFSLSLNGEIVETNLKKLGPGENRIIKEIIPSINPYEFGNKNFEIVLKDSSGAIIARLYFTVELQLSVVNLIVFYLIPIIIPIAIILFYKNKDIKRKLLRR